jgi:hypothetical protein
MKLRAQRNKAYKLARSNKTDASTPLNAGA